MLIELTDQESDYLYRLLYTTRPMSEIEGIVMKMRQQAALRQQLTGAAAALPPGNGHDAQEATQ